MVDRPGASVAAVVVTRDRRELLSECLTSIAAQTRPPDEVVVVDNASSDGTVEMVEQDFPEATLVSLATNQGGAGGFHEGMRLAFDRGHDWLWLMDDDTLPTPTALARLLEALPSGNGLPTPALLASKVVWTDGRLHPKNIPWPRVDSDHRETLVDAASCGLLSIRAATFVSVLVHRRAIEAHGLPHKHYFIWGDDGEFTARVLKDAAGYLVPNSVVHHKTPQPESVHRAGSPQYYYEVRNKLFMLRGHSWSRRDKVSLLASLLSGLRDYAVETRLRDGGLRLLGRAIRDGVRQPAE